MKCIFSIIIYLCFGTFSYAQIITDRPDQTESSSTVPGGSLQIESGIQVAFDGEGESESQEWLLPTSLFRFGIFPRVELRLLSQYESIKFKEKKLQGISDLELGTKIQFLKNSTSKTEIAFLAHVILPTGSPNFTADKVGFFNKVCISHSLNERSGIGYNIGSYYDVNEVFGLTYSLSYAFSVNDRLGIYLEPFGEIVVDDSEYTINFDTGFTYLFNPNLQFDFSFGTGFLDTYNYIALGCSWLFIKNK